MMKISVVDRIKPQRLFACQRLFGMDHETALSRACEGRFDAKPGVPWVRRLLGIHFDHMIAAAADSRVLQPALIRMKPAHAFGAKDVEKRRAVFVEPNGL